MKKVALYGNSLVVSSIGASLNKISDLQIFLLDPAAPDPKDQLLDLQPDIILFDLASTEPSWLITLWKEQPQLLLIGVDQDKGSAMMFSSQPARLMTTEDLLQVIASHAGDESEADDLLLR